MSDLKLETSFGFLIEKYMRQVVWFFVKPQNGPFWPVFAFGVFQWILGPKTDRGPFTGSLDRMCCVELVRDYTS